MPSRPRSPIEVAALAFICLCFFGITVSLIPLTPQDLETNFCPQQPPIDPGIVAPHLAKSSSFLEPKYKQKSIKLLQGAIRIPTEVHDGMEFNDPRFLAFEQLRSYLVDKFPLAAKQLEVVNKYGLLYTFPGKGEGTLLMAHQDVVPAGDANDWHYPPYEAHYDGQYIHGRGASDSKNVLIAILESVESLLEQGWKPNSPLVIAFGFDKEIGGTFGSQEIANILDTRYGHQSFKIAVDEGLGVEKLYGSNIALAGVNEKGTIDVELELKTSGGHSSNPPDHTGIGIMARLVRKLEKNPHDALLPYDNPILQTYRCIAEHSNDMPKEDRRAILDPESRRQRLKFVKQDPQFHSAIRTTQSINYIDGGVKVNALPESVKAIINHHVSVDSSTQAVIDRVEHFVLQTADKFDLEVWSGNNKLRSGPRGNISIASLNQHDPSPVSPYTGHIWNLFAGTTKHIFEDVAGKNQGFIVAPSILTSSTDTHYYWDLTRSIYRFSPGYERDSLSRHTSNERLLVRSHLIAVAWYYELIINMTL